MEAITALFEDFDLTTLVPELPPLLEKLHSSMVYLVLIGPALLVLLGLIYLLIPPKEANHHFGFRTFFGMGSVAAWRYTQRLAGIVLGGLGLILSVVMWLLSKKFPGMELEELFNTVAVYLLWQMGLTLLAYIALTVTAAVLFDRRGNYRWKRRK